MLKVSACGAALVLIIGMAGCSGGSLDRSSAKTALQDRFKDDVSGFMVQFGRMGPHCMTEEDGKQVQEDLTPDKIVEIVAAREAGYVSVTPDGPDYWQVTLTGKGKAAPNMERLRVHDYHNTLNGCDYRTILFSVAAMEIVAVTGISGDQKKAADTHMAEFQWRWKPTELGEMLRENGSVYQKLTPEQRKKLFVYNPTDHAHVNIPVPSNDDIRSAVLPFKKYDDGWRLQAPPKVSDRRR